MMRLRLSAGASGLLRGLAQRSEVPRDRVLLTEWQSVDWQSLTFVGERHQITLRLTGPDARAAADRMCTGLADTDFAIAGQIVADIAVVGTSEPADDGSLTVKIEALTIAE